MPNVLKVAVISDLHAFSTLPPNGRRPSHIYAGAPLASSTENPLAGLIFLFEKDNLKADLLLCGGDMANQAEPVAMSYIWREIQNLKTALGAEFAIATAGNHDVDSRQIYNDHDAKGYLQTLKPMFPGLKEDLCDRFWSRNFAALVGDNWKLLVLNSSAYHGGGKDKEEEYSHGRVSDNTIAAIQEYLKNCPPKPVNILLCHHHPSRVNGFKGTDYSDMKGGEHLIRMLDNASYGRWIIVHGHRHVPRLVKAEGHLSAPIIFGAGSLSAELYLEIQSQARNQFYIIEFPIAEFSKLGLDIAGEIRAWDWHAGLGWQEARASSGMPRRSGFGYAPSSLSILGGMVKSQLTTSETITWQQLIQLHPEIKYLTPGNLDQFISHLKNDGIVSIKDEHGEIMTMGFQLKTSTAKS